MSNDTDFHYQTFITARKATFLDLNNLFDFDFLFSGQKGRKVKSITKEEKSIHLDLSEFPEIAFVEQV